MNSNDRITKTLTGLIVIVAFVVLMTLITIRYYDESQQAMREAQERSAERLSIRLKTYDQNRFTSVFDSPDTFLGPDLGDSLFFVYRMMGEADYFSAEQELRTLWIFYPKSLRVNATLGAVLVAQEKYADAERFFAICEYLSPGNPFIRFRVAHGCLASGDLERGRVLLDSVRNGLPESGEIDFLDAFLLYKGGKEEDARKKFERAKAGYGQNFDMLCRGGFQEFRSAMESQEKKTPAAPSESDPVNREASHE